MHVAYEKKKRKVKRRRRRGEIRGTRTHPISPTGSSVSRRGFLVLAIESSSSPSPCSPGAIGFRFRRSCGGSSARVEGIEAEEDEEEK